MWRAVEPVYKAAPLGGPVSAARPYHCAVLLIRVPLLMVSYGSAETPAGPTVVLRGDRYV